MINTDKLDLINYLLEDNKRLIIPNSKRLTWKELGNKFNLTEDSARKTWAKYKKDNNFTEKYKDNKYIFTTGFENTNSIAAQAQYIAELEDKVVKLACENNTPKDRLVRSMNIGPNPLDISLELQKETILAEMKRASTKVVRLGDMISRPRSPKDNLLELSLFDLHIGKLSWDKETGEDYDISIATKRYKDAIDTLISRVNISDIDRILLPIGNDMLNVDNKTSTTTAGTPQTCDSRFGKMFRAAKELLIDTITALSHLAPVDVVVIPGNHDELTMFSLGEVLDAWFHNNKIVTIFNSPKLRKYYQYGSNMLMFTHGNREKHFELGMVAATEEPLMWANTKYREVHLGHFHKAKVISYINVDEYQGFKVRILPSLSGTDAWHYSKGYMSNKTAKAFVWNKDNGLISEHNYNI